MNNFQRGEAIELLILQTTVEPAQIEAYPDYALDAWLRELGFEWDATKGIGGAYVPIPEPPPVFAAVPMIVVDSASDGNWGPLFSQ